MTRADSYCGPWLDRESGAALVWLVPAVVFVALALTACKREPYPTPRPPPTAAPHAVDPCANGACELPRRR